MYGIIVDILLIVIVLLFGIVGSFKGIFNFLTSPALAVCPFDGKLNR